VLLFVVYRYGSQRVITGDQSNFESLFVLLAVAS
jgi:hypothetical protein